MNREANRNLDKGTSSLHSVRPNRLRAETLDAVRQRVRLSAVWDYEASTQHKPIRTTLAECTISTVSLWSFFPTVRLDLDDWEGDAGTLQTSVAMKL